MTSEKQIKANRKNSQKSTGPKTDLGKSVSSKNSIIHGLLSVEAYLPWESLISFVQVAESFYTDLKPEGAVETLFVERIIQLTWKLRRVGRMDYGLISGHRRSLHIKLHKENTCVETLTEQNIEQIENKMKQLHDATEIGHIFSIETNVFINLSRYEASIEKSLFKALHELQRLQATRHGQVVHAPIAIDVHGDFEHVDK